MRDSSKQGAGGALVHEVAVAEGPEPPEVGYGEDESSVSDEIVNELLGKPSSLPGACQFFFYRMRCGLGLKKI